MTDSVANEAVEIIRIYDLLYSFGITANYSGFFHVSYGVYLAAKQPERLLLIKKWLYPEVAKRYGTTWNDVEHNICTIAAGMWNNSRSRLEHMARCALPDRPSASRFLGILADALHTDHAA